MTASDNLVVTILGSGTSQGVPLLGCECDVCQSTDPRDARTRCSIYVTDGTTSFLIDTPPELRLQCVREKIKQVDAVLITHPHADHIVGFDDLRRFCEMTGDRIPVYGSQWSLDSLQRLFGYAFDPNQQILTYVRAIAHLIDGTFQLGGIEITPLPVPHGKDIVLGFLISIGGAKFVAYISDCSEVPPDVRALIDQVPVLIIDGLRDQPHPSHLTSGQAIQIGEEIKAGKTYLTHLTHHKSHLEREVGLPKSCFIAYDGLKITL